MCKTTVSLTEGSNAARGKHMHSSTEDLRVRRRKSACCVVEGPTATPPRTGVCTETPLPRVGVCSAPRFSLPLVSAVRPVC